MSIENFPPFILEKIQAGQAILFLGAGASFGAIHGESSKPLSGDDLRDKLCDKFLGGRLKDRQLSYVAEVAKNQASLYDVQNYIKSLFVGIEPAAFHKLIPTFRWHAIVTTNYDFLIERAYREVSNRKQNPVVFLGDDDEFTKATEDINSVPLLKIHGCISKINDPNLPLILALEEYAKYKENRTCLFKLFSDWARQYPIIFCGYELADPNVAQILYEIGDASINRPQHVIVKRSFEALDISYYQSRRIHPIQSTFENFITYLDDTIPDSNRQLAALIDTKIPLSKWITSGTPSAGLSLYLLTELEYVNQDLSSESIPPCEFFTGIGSPWGVFNENYDSKRRITDSLLSEVIIEQNLESTCNIFLIHGHAGSGKTVILKRVAWNASTKYSRLVFYLKEGGSIRKEFIEEIWQLTNEPFFVFIDSCNTHINKLKEIHEYCTRFSIPVSFLIEARSNEWNNIGEPLEKHLSKQYDVFDLSRKEIDSLLENLELFDCLGSLEEIPPEQRAEHLRTSSDKQLLVALLEATHGKSFEDIVLDEYNNIVPQEAKSLYLDISSLHQFGVPVRAGLISRISNISFTHFAGKLLRPLERVVYTFVDSHSRDNAYRCRHRDIAKIIFERVLSSPDLRVEQLVRIISNMNVDYESDYIAFKQLIKGRNVADAFSNRELGQRIYKAALISGANKSYILHQQAIFELKHPSGNPTFSLALINDSLRAANYGQKAIRHTKATILRALANSTDDAFTKEKYRAEGKSILSHQLGKRNSSYAYNELAAILLDEIRERTRYLDESDNANEGAPKDRVMEQLVTELEDVFYKGIQEHPGDEYLLMRESAYRTLIGENPRAKQLIEAAYKQNPNSAYVAITLAKMYSRDGNIDKSITILKDALENNPRSKQLHLSISEHYIKLSESKYRSEIDHHLARSFTDGDSNYDAQFWYARHDFLYGDRKRAEKIWYSLRITKLPPFFKKKPRGPVKTDENSPAIYTGSVVSLHDNYCFVKCEELSIDIFISQSSFQLDDWDDVYEYSKINFELWFNLLGPVGMNAIVNS